MTNRLQLDGCVGSYTLGKNEPVSSALLNDLICEAQDANVLFVDLLIPITRVSAERGVLEVSAQWTYSGTVQTNENNQVVVYAQYRHAIHRTGSVDGNLAVAPPTSQITDAEEAAIRLMQERYGRTE